MGTIIISVVEVRGPEGWVENTTPVFTSNSHHPDGQIEGHSSKGFFCQSYIMFALFADVRTRDYGVVPIAPGRGLPDDAAESSLYELLGGWDLNGGFGFHDEPDFELSVSEKIKRRNNEETYDFSWISGAELLAVDYEAVITSIENPANARTLRDELGANFFEHLDQLNSLGRPDDVRILFGFAG
ncbi:hypothetical protein [Pseudomonas lactis]|uniref:hypothetical protein n=1 Tax=Pseudomonas lactis TaxID=1615674 RepID=UPI003F7E6464